ncbi:hypothetical protein AUK22_04380 [bacterium CG2_30_54_10]|nr:MAG: hypothetical protein AUK22_04380 [bacterium CG2_30_54_10]
MNQPNEFPISELGIIGCGGAGFPTHVKLAARGLDYLIVNGAECEPLLHKDKELLEHLTDQFFAGLRCAIEVTQAKIGFIAVKEKYPALLKHLEKAIADRSSAEVMGERFGNPRLQLLPLGDFYPAGDEYELVYEASKRLMPHGGIPLNVGCVVVNVETILLLGGGKPMTSKFLTITGKVPHPLTVEVPIGIAVREAMALTGIRDLTGLTVIDGGPMMGKIITDIDAEVVKKTCGGLIALPNEHPLIVKMTRPNEGNRRVARSACDQCTDCTELCPRFLLGYPIKPHKAMRAAQFAPFNDQNYSVESVFCCECGLCSLFACPEDLPPREMAVMAKKYHLGRGVKLTDWKNAPTIHPMRSARRVSIDRLLKKIGLLDYDRKAPLTNIEIRFEKVKLPLKMHIGAPSIPIVKAGDRVQVGQKIGEIPEKKLGAALHASISGRVAEVSGDAITIVRE